MKTNNFWIRIFGIFGITGGLTLFTGDMLFYYDPATTNLNENMGNVSVFRKGLFAWIYNIYLNLSCLNPCSYPAFKWY